MLVYLGYGLLLILVAYLIATTGYLLILGGAYFVRSERPSGSQSPLNRFAVLVPAHNEELLIGNLCESLLEVDYPKDRYVIHIVADNCTDRTVEICSKYDVELLVRDDPENAGKGQALAWALQEFELDKFDSVFMVDADNYVDSGILRELNGLMNGGEMAVQCYNSVGNRADSWFTELLFVSRTIGNQLYHEAKHRLGLSAYLMGNGLCFNAQLLRERGWTAFTNAEDWEYYAQLVEGGIRVGFAERAKVFHQESKSLNQATSQRVRWSSGRFNVAKTLGVRLLLKGIRDRSWHTIDASFPLIFPNYSLLTNLTLGALALTLLLPLNSMKPVLLGAVFALLFFQFVLFVTGAILAGSPLRTLKATLFAPFFLVWKAAIDLLCFTGLYGGKSWVRTKRHRSTD